MGEPTTASPLATSLDEEAGGQREVDRRVAVRGNGAMPLPMPNPALSPSELPSPPSGAARFVTRLKRFLARLLLLTAILALCAATLVALSELNARTWKLEVRHGHLVVLKGRLLPFGVEPWVPMDGEVAEAYAPLDLEGQGAADVDGHSFSERAELDRAFFTVLERLAAPRLGATARAELERGLALLRRAARLSGLDDPQRHRLRRMQAEMGFALAKLRLESARAQIDEALGQLRVTAESDVRAAGAAARVLAALEPRLRELSATLREVVDGTMAGATPASPPPSDVLPPRAPDAAASTGSTPTVPPPGDAPSPRALDGGSTPGVDSDARTPDAPGLSPSGASR